MTFTALARFQFHEGPIKTFLYENSFECWDLFQFHEGPIKTKYKDKKQQKEFVSIP